jgi:hypothetical protein
MFTNNEDEEVKVYKSQLHTHTHTHTHTYLTLTVHSNCNVHCEVRNARALLQITHTSIRRSLYHQLPSF